MKVIDSIKALGINTSSCFAAVRSASLKYEGASQEQYEGLILDLVNEPLHPIHAKEAELLAGYLIQETVRAAETGILLENAEAIALARAKTSVFLTRNPWCVPSVVVSFEEVTNDEGEKVTIKVSKPKKGSGPTQRERSIALFKTREAWTRKEFIEVLVKELGLTAGGASTYAFNCMKGIWK